MAGTEIIWKCTFDDDNNNECRIEIRQDGYAGATTEVTGGETPCVIRMLAEGDGKFTHIKSTEAVIELISDTSLQYLNLFISPVKTYYVRIYRASDLIWTGWINPEFYSEPLAAPKYPVTITATDGLAELKNIPFPLPSYTTFKYSFIYYIAKCLEQTGFTLDIRTAIDLTATTTADGAVTSRILEYLFLDYRSLRDSETGEFWSCYDVLSEILSTLNARLYQCNNTWFIDSLDPKHAAVNYERYLYTGTYHSTASVDPVVTLTAHTGRGTDIRFINSPAMVEIQPAYKRFTINHEWGNRKNILKSSNFDGLFLDDDFTTNTDLRYWDEDKGTETAQVAKVEMADGSNVLLMKPISYANTQVPSFTAYIRPIETAGSGFVFVSTEGVSDETGLMNWIYGYGCLRLRYQLFANLQTYFESEPKLRSYVRVYINCSGTIYRIWTDQDSVMTDANGYEWVEAVSGTPVTYNESHITVTPGKSTWTEVDLNLAFPPQEVGNTQTYIGFMIEISSPNLNAATVSTAGDGIYYKDIALYFVDGTENDMIDTPEGRKIAEKRYKINLNASRVDEEVKKVEFSKDHSYDIDSKNILEPETYNVKFAESPPPYSTDGYGLVNRFVVFDSAGNAVNDFGTCGGTMYPSFTTQVLKDQLNGTYRQPLFLLRGSIIDTTIADQDVGLSFYKTLKDYDLRYYFHTGMEYEMKHCIFSGEWMQFWSEATTGGEFNDDFNEDFWI